MYSESHYISTKPHFHERVGIKLIEKQPAVGSPAAGFSLFGKSKSRIPKAVVLCYNYKKV